MKVNIHIEKFTNLDFLAMGLIGFVIICGVFWDEYNISGSINVDNINRNIYGDLGMKIIKNTKKIDLHCEQCGKFICQAIQKGWRVLDQHIILERHNVFYTNDGAFVHAECYEKYRFPWRNKWLVNI